MLFVQPSPWQQQGGGGGGGPSGLLPTPQGQQSGGGGAWGGNATGGNLLGSLLNSGGNANLANIAGHLAQVMGSGGGGGGGASNMGGGGYGGGYSRGGVSVASYEALCPKKNRVQLFHSLSIFFYCHDIAGFYKVREEAYTVLLWRL